MQIQYGYGAEGAITSRYSLFYLSYGVQSQTGEDVLLILTHPCQ